MRLIGELGSSQQAHAFTAYLLVSGIDSHVDHDAGKFEVWVKEEDRFKEALSILDEFKANPNDPKYAEAVPQAKAIVKSEVKKRQQIQKKVVRVNASNISRRPPLTVIIIGICILVAVMTNFGDRKSFDGPVMQALAFTSISKAEVAEIEPPINPAERDSLRLRTMSLSKGEVWRAVTPIFIHFGIFHIAFNLYMFFQFGSIIELKYGTFKFGMLILATAVISNFFQCTVPEALGGSGPYTTSDVWITQLGGMSGVVYGLFGFFWMKSTYDRSFGYRMPQSTVYILIGWLFFCMIPVEIRAPLMSVNVGNWAHGVGLAVGMVAGYLSSVMK